MRQSTWRHRWRAQHNSYPRGKKNPSVKTVVKRAGITKASEKRRWICLVDQRRNLSPAVSPVLKTQASGWRTSRRIAREGATARQNYLPEKKRDATATETWKPWRKWSESSFVERTGSRDALKGKPAEGTRYLEHRAKVWRVWKPRRKTSTNLPRNPAAEWPLVSSWSDWPKSVRRRSTTSGWVSWW